MSGRLAMRLAGIALSILAGALFALGGDASELGFDFESKPDEHWKLPKQLREVSGLATAPGNRLFAHDDERATIHELDPWRGRLRKSFHLSDEGSSDEKSKGKGKKKAAGKKADFEGLAVAGERFFLVTSDGRLYETREGEDAESVPFRTHETGLEKECEVEGLAYDPSSESLLLACKEARTKKLQHFVAIHRWSLTREALDEPAILIAHSELRQGSEESEFHPSGIARHPTTGHLFLVAAREGALAEITPGGQVRGRVALPERHLQAEGIAFLSDGSLVLGDEGEKKRARLSVYKPR